MLDRRALYRIEAVVQDAQGKHMTVKEYIQAETKEDAQALVIGRLAERGLSFQSANRITRGGFAEEAKLPPERPRARWEVHPEDPTLQRFEFFPTAYVILSTVAEKDGYYRVWLELNGQPSLDDVPMYCADDDLETLKTAACSTGGQMVYDMVQVLYRYVTHRGG